MCLNCDATRRGFLRLGLGAAGLAALPRRSSAAFQKPLIMLDPGHGGHDPGAIAPDGYYEKTIALEAGLELRRSLLTRGATSSNDTLNGYFHLAGRAR